MNSVFFDHHSQVPKDLWRWPNFRPAEIASKGNGSILINFDAMDKLQAGRIIAGKPFIIHSAFRDELYNAMVGGAPRSYHVEGRAFDIGISNFRKDELVAILKQAGFTGFGLNYRSFVHADTGRERNW